MSDVHLELKDPAVMRAVCDVPTMQRWEILRRSPRALSVTEVAEQAGSSVEAAQRSLDVLVDAGFVKRVPASRGRRQVSYRSAVKRLFLRWDRSDPEGVAAARTLGDSMRDHSRRIVDAAAARPGAEQFETISISGHSSVMLLKDDADRVRESYLATYAMLAEADRRARACPDQTEATPFHIAFDFRRLWEPELPMAEFFVSESALHDRERKLFEKGVAAILSPRELEIAKLLERGKSRPEVARELGLAINTVASLSKVIYRKLGIHSRAQLTERLRIV
jgi:DNA-binding CsgD family transcriptional regulator/DNA-binding Lrp family transcriptional regulator